MPEYNARSPKLSGASGAVVTIQLNRKGHKYVEVANWSAANLAFTVSQGGTTAEPTDVAAEKDFLGPYEKAVVESYDEPDVVKITGDAAFVVSVRGVQQ